MRGIRALGVILVLAVVGLLSYAAGGARLLDAKAEEGYQVGALVTTAGVVSSNGATAVPLLAIPGGSTAPPVHRFWVGGMTVFNTDTVSHPAALVSHHSGRVIWEAPLAAGQAAIIDNVNMAFSDVGTATAAEGVDLVTESSGGAKIGAVGAGYYK